MAPSRLFEAADETIRLSSAARTRAVSKLQVIGRQHWCGFVDRALVDALGRGRFAAVLVGVADGDAELEQLVGEPWNSESMRCSMVLSIATSAALVWALAFGSALRIRPSTKVLSAVARCA